MQDAGCNLITLDRQQLERLPPAQPVLTPAKALARLDERETNRR